MKIKPISSGPVEFGCVSAILHHLRCRHRISIGEEYAEAVELCGTEAKPQSPNIVARLMGLDSMPISSNSGDSNSLSTSGSRNSVQSWPGVLTERTNSSPTDSSVSFHEKPIYLREENDEFLILTFKPDEDEDEDEDEEQNLANWGKCKSVTAIQRKRRRSIRRKPRREKCTGNACEEENRRNFEKVKRKQGFLKRDENGELPLILDLERIKLAQKKLEAECSSQNSSPVSVLELPEPSDECPTQPNSPNSDLEEAKPEAKQRSSRRKLSLNFDNSEGSISAGNFRANEESNRTNNRRITERDRTALKRFVEEDFKSSTWVEKEIETPACAKEIAAEIGFDILDALVSEITSEMCLKF